jgi:RND family efflux transporter MFP subunit
MNDLKTDLASLRIEKTGRTAKPSRRWLLVLFVLLVGALAAWALGSASTPVVDTVRPTVTVASHGAGASLLSASGYVVARRKAVVSAKIQGRLSELRVEEGSRVREGDVLSRLESGDVQAQVVRARAQIQHAEADLAENQRQLRMAESLHNDQVVSTDTVEAAQSRVRLAEASLAQSRADLRFAEEQLQNTVIRAPFTGTVVKKMAEVGESVAPIPPGVNISTSSGAIVALADLDTLEVEADVSESNVGKLKDAQPAEVTVEAFPDKRYRAVLRQIIPTADRTKATVQVKVTILDKDAALKPEMSAKVSFLEAPLEATVQAKPVMTIPETAVVRRGTEAAVFAILGGQARTRTIETGPTQAGQVVVKGGLMGDETLIVRPAADLKDGDRVRIKAS